MVSYLPTAENFNYEVFLENVPAELCRKFIKIVNKTVQKRFPTSPNMAVCVGRSTDEIPLLALSQKLDADFYYSFENVHREGECVNLRYT